MNMLLTESGVAIITIRRNALLFDLATHKVWRKNYFKDWLKAPWKLSYLYSWYLVGVRIKDTKRLLNDLP